ncbi:EAL domain-containing protein [Vibrio fluvialis]|nr:EAL domain-containing protein [Vibrio fluvialis]
MRMTCQTCKMKGECTFSYLGVNSKHFSCNHYQVTQNIIDRNFNFFGVEILSRPRMKPKQKCESYGNDYIDCHDDYFKKLNVLEHNKLLNEIIFKINKSLDGGHFIPRNIFLNVEKFSLLDSNLVGKLLLISNKLRIINKNLIVEVTERHENINEIVIQTMPNLRDQGLDLALDDYEFRVVDGHIINHFNYVKIKILELYRHKDITDKLYYLVENNKKIIVENIETKEQMNFALSLPIHYFQGFYV